MVAKDDLFQLIKALSNSEKRYFKIFASRHTYAEEHNLVELFDEIDRFDEYDEEKLKKKLLKKKSNASVVKYLSAEKKALHELIMRGMRSFHGEKTVDVQLHDLMTDEIFYHGKSLYELQAKTLYKAKKLAEEYEKFPVLLILLQREAKMLIERKTKDYDEVRNRVHKEERELLKKIVNESELRLLRSDIFMYMRSGTNIRSATFQEILEEKSLPLLQKSEKDALSFNARKHYNSAMRSYYRLKSDFIKSSEYCKNIVKLFEEHPALKEEYRIEYKIALANYLGSCHSTHRYDEFENTLHKMKSMPSKSLDEEGEVFQDATLYELLYYLNTGKYSEGIKAVPEIEKGIECYAIKINKASELAIYYNICVLYFIMEDWKNAQRWATKIIDQKTDSRKDLQHFARILQLIFHYETGKGEMMDYLTRSVYRYLEKEENLLAFERIVLNYLKKLPFTLNQQELLKSFIILKDEIERLKNTSGEKTRVGMEEIVVWLTAKTENKKLQEVMRELK
jgi:hypothetical protein